MDILWEAIMCPPLTVHHLENKLISTFRDVTAIRRGDRCPPHIHYHLDMCRVAWIHDMLRYNKVSS